VARTRPEPPDRQGQRGFALVLALFLLATASALGLIIGGNGLSARKSARAASLAVAAQERAAMATWMTADLLEQPQKSSHFSFSIEGRRVETALSPESGRIDLNGLPVGGLVQALEELGYEPASADRAAKSIVGWRGPSSPDPRGLTMGLPDGRQAFWSVDDLDEVAGLEPGIRNCLKQWGTVHARGPFIRASMTQPLSLISEIGDSGNVVVGSMIRINVLDQLSGMEFRSVLLYSGGRAVSLATTDTRSSPWLLMEWLNPARDIKCEAGR